MTAAAQPARFSTARGAALLLVLVQCLTLAFLEHGYWFAGIASVAAVLSDVVQVLIRAEHGDGEDWSELRALHLIERAPPPVDEPEPVPLGKG